MNKICPICKNEHNEWHGNDICFSCATDKLLLKTKKLAKELE